MRALVGFALLAACSTTATPATPSAPVSVTSATRVTGAASCDRASPTVTTCRYGDASSPIFVRFQTSTTPADFAASRRIFDDSGVPTTDVAGLGDQAYASTTLAVNTPLTTLVVLKGTTEVEVDAPAPTTLDALRRLTIEILPQR